MKVPEYIKKEMKKVITFSNKAAFSMDNIEKWLRENGFETDFEADNSLRDGSGISLEELEYGNDVIDELCERIEEMWREKHGKEN